MHAVKTIHKTFLVTAFLLASSSAIFAKANPIDTQVQLKFETAYDDCDTFMADDQGKIVPQIYRLTYRNNYPSAPLLDFRLYEYPCYQGAYNRNSVYFSADDYGEIRQVFFAYPEFDLTYKDDESKILDQITLVGFSAVGTLTNPDFDPETQTLYSRSAWRGLGDASSLGQWVFSRGRFVLKTYDVDPTYDGEVKHIRIYGEGQPEIYN